MKVTPSFPCVNLHAPKAQILWRLNYSFTLLSPFGASSCKSHLTYVISKLRALQQQQQQQQRPLTAILNIQEPPGKEYKTFPASFHTVQMM